MIVARIPLLCLLLLLPSTLKADPASSWSAADQLLFECATSNNKGNVRWIAALRQGKSGLSGDALNAAMFNAGNVVVNGCPKNGANGQKVTVRIMQISDRYTDGLNESRPQDAVSNCVIEREPEQATSFIRNYDAAMLVLADAIISGASEQSVAPVLEAKLDAALTPLKQALKNCAEVQKFDEQMDVAGFYSVVNWKLRAEPILAKEASSLRGSI
jgi:hypothetical protein